MFIVIGICLVGCKNNIVEPEDPLEIPVDTVEAVQHFLWPSGAGSQWNYERYDNPGFGYFDTVWVYQGYSSFGFDMDSLELIDNYTVEIMGQPYFTLNDTAYHAHIQKSTYASTGNSGNKIFWIGESGVFSLGAFDAENDTLLKKGLYLPQELSKNKTWDSQFINWGPSGITALVPDQTKLIATNDTMVTPAGTFNDTYVVRTLIREAEDYPGYATFYEYYAPGVGLVARVRIFIVPDFYWFLDYVDLLKSYELKQ